MAQNAAVAPNSQNTIQPVACAVKPCIVCWLKAQIENSPAKAATFSTGPLQLNLIGLRHEDTLSDRFDDHFIVAFRMLGPSSSKSAQQLKDDFEKKIEQRLRDELTETFGKVKDAFKLVPCSSGYWIVGRFTISTDPGFTQTLKRQTDLLATVKKSLEELQDAQKDLKAHAKKALDDAGKALPTEKTKLRGLAHKKDLAATDLDPIIKALTERKTQLENEPDVPVPQETEKPASADDPFANIQGWEEQHRAVLPAGYYRDLYRISAHHAGSAKKFQSSSAALCFQGYVPGGVRLYTANGLANHYLEIDKASQDAAQNSSNYEYKKNNPDKDAPPNPYKAPLTLSKKEFTLVQRGLGPHKERESSALVRLEPTGQGDSQQYRPVLVMNQTETPLKDDEVLLITPPEGDRVAGTNIHRAHHIDVDLKTGKLKLPDSQYRVGDWSEGCQVFPHPDDYTYFIRLVGLVRRWNCDKCNSPQCDFLEYKSGDELGAGEDAIFRGLGESFIDLATVAYVQKTELSDAQKKLAKAFDETDWSLKHESKLRELRKKAVALLASGKPTKKIDSEIQKIETERSDKATEEQRKQIDDCYDSADELSVALEQLTKWGNYLSSPKHHSKPEEELGEKAIQLRRDFLRYRTAVLAADLLRACDFAGVPKPPPTLSEQAESAETEAHGTKSKGHHSAKKTKVHAENPNAPACPFRFSYSLIELSPADIKTAEHKFNDPRNKPWDGTFVLGA